MKKIKERIKNYQDSKNSGFTLVELIVVIVILAILVGVTIGGIYSYVNKSRINTDINNASSIQSVASTIGTNATVLSANGTYTLTWSAATAADSISITKGADVSTDNSATINTELKKLLTDGLPAAKAGGHFDLVVSVSNAGSADANVTVTCKAYKDSTHTEGKDTALSAS